MIRRLTAPVFFRLLAVLTVTVLSCLTLAAPASAQDGTPKDFLQNLYKPFLIKGDQEKNGVDYLNDEKVGLYFDETLTKSILADAKEAEAAGEIGRLDFDPFINAQDYEIKSVNITIVSEDKEKAKGVATFRNAGRLTKVTYDLVKTAKGWRIANISWNGTQETLLSILSSPL